MARRTGADRVAAAIARFCGSMTFVWIHVLVFAAWIGYNALPWFHPFDPYPFTFLTLVVSLEAIFLSTFILISQNYDMRVSERRNQLDLQINLLAEQENTKTLQMLERIAKKVGAHLGDDPQVRALEEATRPDSLVDQIEEAYRQDAGQPPRQRRQVTAALDERRDQLFGGQHALDRRPFQHALQVRAEVRALARRPLVGEVAGPAAQREDVGIQRAVLRAAEPALAVAGQFGIELPEQCRRSCVRHAA